MANCANCKLPVKNAGAHCSGHVCQVPFGNKCHRRDSTAQSSTTQTTQDLSDFINDTANSPNSVSTEAPPTAYRPHCIITQFIEISSVCMFLTCYILYIRTAILFISFIHREKNKKSFYYTEHNEKFGSTCFFFTWTAFYTVDSH